MGQSADLALGGAAPSLARTGKRRRLKFTRTHVAAIAIALALATGSAHATPKSERRHLRLSWARGANAERCVGTSGLEEDVKARLGYDPFVPANDALSVDGYVSRSPRTSSFRAELTIRDASGNVLGTRHLSSSQLDCRSLGEAVAMAIVIAVDPDASGERLIEEEERAPAEASPPEVAPRVSRRESPSRIHTFATGGASLGTLPMLAPVASLHARAIAGRWEIGIGMHLWPESRTSDRIGGFALATASLDVCMMASTGGGWNVLRWCVAGHLGRMDVSVHSVDLAPVEVGAFPWAGAETGPSVSIPMPFSSNLRLEAALTALVPFVRRDALVSGRSTPVWTQPWVGAQANLGAGLEF